MTYLVQRIDLEKTARSLLMKYGSRNNVMLHKNELVRSYGAERFDALMMEMGIIEDSGWEEIQKEREKQNTAERLKKFARQEDVRTDADGLYVFLKSHFTSHAEYEFTVTERWFIDNQQKLVVDMYGYVHPVAVPYRYKGGEKVICEVVGVNYDTTPDGEPLVYLKLSFPRSPEDIPTGEPKHYLKSPEMWNREVEGMGKHKCGKPFTCSCCGRFFPASYGFRVDGKDIYFCNYCKKQVYTKSGRGWSGVIISTPMGNKR